jgi:diguanylate cyclase (GGDEF)-like protein
MTARSAYAAVHDVLTGLCNRSTLLARGNAQLLRFDAETVAGGDGPQTLVALVLLDIDGLRAVNDALSYAAGDEVLRVLARRLAANQRAGEIVARLGGDEFAILLVEPAVVGTARDWSYPVDRARQFLTLLAEPAEVANVTIAVEASAGVVVEAAGGCDMAELLRRADVALRQAKRRAARVVRYEAANDGASTGRLALLAELRDALATTDQLLLYLQPTVDLVTGGATGAEALLRWRHPRRGLLEPGEFLGAVEHSELAGGLTLHVVDLALRVAAGWQEQGLRRPISVNLCARCLLDPTLPAAVAELLTTHGVAPHRLIVEITEAVMGAELAVVDSVIQGLRDIGVGVSVDNFGTESASLEFLTRFAVDEVKIDRAFVAAMADSPEVAAIVRATVDLARELGLRVVAEGVERPDQRAALVDLGVTSAQGFLFHRPLGVAEATTVLLGQ